MKTEQWNGYPIRFVDHEGEWWAVLADIANALGLNQRKIKQRLPHEVLSKHPIRDSKNRMQEMLIVNEFGIYETIFSSRKKEAKEFKKWVKQILKEIRQQGYYMAGELIEEPKTSQTPDHNDYINQLLQRAIDEPDLTKKFKRIQEIYCTANVIEQIETGVGRKFEPLYKD